MLLDMHADHRSFDPCAFDQSLHGRLATVELVLVAMLGHELEAREVAETVVDQRLYLAGKLDA